MTVIKVEIILSVQSLNEQVLE